VGSLQQLVIPEVGSQVTMLFDAATNGTLGGDVEVCGTVEQIGVKLQLKLTDERQRAHAARV